MQARFFSAGKEVTKQIIKTLKDIYPEPSLPAPSLSELASSKPLEPSSPKPTRSSLSKLKSWGLGLLLSISVKAEEVKPKAEEVKLKPEEIELKPEEIKARSYLQRVQKLYKKAAERTDKPVDDYVVPFL